MIPIRIAQIATDKDGSITSVDLIPTTESGMPRHDGATFSDDEKAALDKILQAAYERTNEERQPAIIKARLLDALKEVEPDPAARKDMFLAAAEEAHNEAEAAVAESLEKSTAEAAKR